MSEELKPCPFCGNKVEMDFYVQDSPFIYCEYYYFIECYQCGYRMIEGLTKLPEVAPELAVVTKNNLKMRWNRRAKNERT